MTTTDLRFPVGHFAFTSADDRSRAESISIIAALPATRAKTFIDNLRTIIAEREEADA